MKKIYLLAAMALIMIGCSSNDEENLPADELLAGTEWRYGTFHDEDVLDTVPSHQITTGDVSGVIDYYFPDVQLVCTKGEVSITEESDSDTLYWYASRPRAKVSFTNRECKYYGDNGFIVVTDKQVRHYSQTTTYIEQSHTSPVNPYISLEVTKDAITLYRLNPYIGEQIEQVCLNLDNFQSNKTWDESTQIGSREVSIAPEEETFNYQRTGNEVVLTNSNKKWIGTLDTDNWTLSFVQIVPEKKEIPTLTLK